MISAMTTKDLILDSAQRLIQTCGYNGFSFRDIAGDIGVKSSSIHYYYPSKSQLAVAVASKYRSDFMDVVHPLLANNETTIGFLNNYAALFQETLKNENRLCLGGMLASELNSVGAEVGSEIKGFFADQHDLLTDVIVRGQSNGEIRADVEASNFGKTYLAALEGAMILARTNGNLSDIELVAKQMIGLIRR